MITSSHSERGRKERKKAMEETRTREKVALIVEDDRAIRQRLKDILDVDGIDSLAYATAEQALADLDGSSQHSPVAADVLLVDVMLKGSKMDGIEFISTLKERGNGQLPAPVIVITASGSSLIEQKTRAIQVDGFLRKPFSLADLRDTIRRCLTITGNRK